MSLAIWIVLEIIGTCPSIFLWRCSSLLGRIASVLAFIVGGIRKVTFLCVVDVDVMNADASIFTSKNTLISDSVAMLTGD